MKFVKIFPFLRRHWRGFFLGTLSLVIVNTLQLSVPALMARAVDSIPHVSSSEKILPFSVLIALAAVLMGFFRYQWRMNIFRSARLFEREMRDQFFGHLLRLPQSFYNTTRAGDLLALAMNDLGAVRMFVGVGILAFVDACVMITMSLIIMATLNFKLLLWVALPLPFISVCTWMVGGRLYRNHERVQSLFGDLSSAVTEDVKGIRVIKSFAREDVRYARFRKLCDSYRAANLRTARLQGLFTPFVRFLGALSLCILLYRGGLDVTTGVMTFGTFVAFTGYIGLLSWPMMAIGWVLNLYSRAHASLDRILEVFERPEIREDAGLRVSSSAGKPEIEARGLTFSYPGEKRPAIDGISFKVPFGKTLAIVGPVGSGKSTLLHLLLRIYEPPEGTLFMGGQDIRSLGLDALREALSFVPQDDFVFSATLKQNLEFGSPDLNEQDAKKLVQQVGMAHEVDGFSDGMDSRIGERGVTLSGGQRQRLCIARALARQAPILLLDDPFSSVDVGTEKKILDDLFGRHDGKTVILVSQRIETVRRADKILVIEEGRVVDEGSHSQLIRSSRLYRDLFERQLLLEHLESHAPKA